MRNLPFNMLTSSASLPVIFENLKPIFAVKINPSRSILPCRLPLKSTSPRDIGFRWKSLLSRLNVTPPPRCAPMSPRQSVDFVIAGEFT